MKKKYILSKVLFVMIISLLFLNQSVLASNGKNYGWVKIDQKWHYFDTNGIRKTGWVKDGSNWYYIEKGVMLKDVKIKDGDYTYYLNSNGVMYRKSSNKGMIKGNIKSMIYHMPGQRYYDTISESNIIYFETEAEAQSAGYRPSKI